MRKQSYLTKLNFRDEKLCSVVKFSQHISQAQALLIVSRNRLENYEKEGVLKKLHYMDNNRKEIVYELTQEGRKWITHNFGHLQGNFYTSTTAIQHNITLAQQIIDRPYFKWYTERDLRELLIREIEQSDNRWELMRRFENGQISVPDGGYITSDGSIECIEITNENYTSGQIAAKERFGEITNIHITFIKQ